MIFHNYLDKILIKMKKKGDYNKNKLLFLIIVLYYIKMIIYF